MNSTAEQTLRYIEPALTRLEDEDLDELITLLSKRIKTPRKILRVLWGAHPEEPYEPYEYTFQTQIEYAAFQECLTEHDGWLECHTDKEVDRYLGVRDISTNDGLEDDEDA